MQSSIREDFVSSLTAEFRANGWVEERAIVHAHVEKAYAYGLDTGEAIGLYVECAMRLERTGFDMDRLEKLIAHPDLDRDHKLIALRMVASEVERGAMKRGPHARR
jgi:2-oxo-4-hydroxy-4-carboxy--5-ureidoimidazoline (OHCU) decarboxylase